MNLYLKNIIYLFLTISIFTGCAKEMEILSKNIIRDVVRVNNGTYSEPLKQESKNDVIKKQNINATDLLTEIENKYPRQLKLDYFKNSKWSGFIYKYDNNKSYFIELYIKSLQNKSELNQLTNIKIYESKNKKKLLSQCSNAMLKLPMKGFFIISKESNGCTDWNNEIFKMSFKRDFLESNMINGLLSDSDWNKKGEFILQRESKYKLSSKVSPKRIYLNTKSANVDYEKSNDSNIFVSLNTNENRSVTDLEILQFDKKNLLVRDGKEIKIWDINKNKIVKKLLVQKGKEQLGIFSAIALSPNKRYLAVAGVFDGPLFDDSSAIHIFDLKKELIVKTFKMKQVDSNAGEMKFSKDGKYLFAMTYSGDLNILDMKKMKFYKSLHFYENSNLSPNSKFKIKKVKSDYEIYVSYQNKFKIYSLKSGKLKREFVSPVKIIDFDISKKDIVIVGGPKKTTLDSLDHNKVFILSKSLKLKKVLLYKDELGIIHSIFNSKKNRLILASANTIYSHDIKKDYKLKKKYKEDVYNLTITKINLLNNNNLAFTNFFNNRITIFDINKFKVKKELGNNITSKMVVSIKGNNIGFTRLNGELLKKYPIQSDIPINNIFNLNTKKITKNSFLNKKTRLHKNLIFGQSNKNSTEILEKTFFGKKQIGKISKITNNSNYAFYKDFIITATYGEIEIYNKKGYKVASLQGQNGWIMDLEVDEDKLVSSGEENISVWDLSKINDSVKFKKLNELSESTYKRLENNKSNFGLKDKNISVKEFYSKLIESNNFYLADELLDVSIINPLVNLLITNDNEWLMWTHKGYFDSSENGFRNIGFHQNRGYKKEARFIEIEKLYDHFYRPDLVKLTLEGKDISPYTKGLSYVDVLKNPAPEIKITKANNKRIKTEKIKHNKNKINLEFNVMSVDNGGVGLIRVYQEGKLIKTIGEGKINRASANAVEDLKTEELAKKAKEEQDKYLALSEESITKSMNGTIDESELLNSIELKESLDNSGLHKITLPLKAGKNRIEIEAFNKTNTVASIREKFTVDAKIKKRKPVVYAIIAGVNEFQDTKRFKNLKYSENDAKAIKDILKLKVKEKVVSTLLLGKDFTKENLFKAINKIKSKARLEDKVVFYVSTHGKVFKGDLYIVPQKNKTKTDFINFENMFKKIQSISALDQVFIIDACEAGKAKDIVSSIYDSKASVLAKQSGVHILLATSKGTFAFEHPDPKIKHGVFTNNILNALKTRKTDKNRDRKISVIELSKVLKSPEYITKHQYPVIRNVGQDTKIRDF